MEGQILPVLPTSPVAREMCPSARRCARAWPKGWVGGCLPQGQVLEGRTLLILPTSPVAREMRPSARRCARARPKGWVGGQMQGGCGPVRASARRSAWRECAAPMPKAKCLPPHEKHLPKAGRRDAIPPRQTARFGVDTVRVLRGSNCLPQLGKLQDPRRGQTARPSKRGNCKTLEEGKLQNPRRGETAKPSKRGNCKTLEEGGIP